MQQLRLIPCLLLMGLIISGVAIASESINAEVPDATLELQIEAPKVVHLGQEFELLLKPSQVTPEALLGAKVQLSTQAKESSAREVQLGDTAETRAAFVIDRPGQNVVTASLAELAAESAPVNAIPGWLSIIPPVIAIGLALWLKTVIPALFLGLWAGVMIQNGLTVASFFNSALEAFTVRVHQVLVDPDHVSIILFSCMIGGLVSIVSRNGGMQGVIDIVIRWANSARRGQLSVWFLGLCIFFDDYTNTMVVGNSVRSVTDKLRISRQKLAYLVDSTAAPVACVAVMTTWIGYQVSLIDTAGQSLPGFTESAYTVFLNSLAYSFYPFMAILFVYLIAFTGRDFGPMLDVERASYRGEAKPSSAQGSSGHQTMNPMVDDSIPCRAVNAVLPILVLVVSCGVGLYVTGEGDSLRDIMSTADAYKALMWSSFAGVATALVLTLGQRILSLSELVDAWTQGVLIMIAPIIILVLAWALSDVTKILHTADFLVRLGGDFLTPASIPAWTFVLSAAAAFATGSSWGVMAIVLPLILPVAWTVLSGDGAVTGDEMHIVYSTVACVLAGSVWGDHCSPISDTTVLSSMAADCDHIEHVRTQIPYAMTVGVVTLLIGVIPSAMGVPWWLSMGLCALALVLVVRYIGKPSNDTT